MILVIAGGLQVLIDLVDEATPTTGRWAWTPTKTVAKATDGQDFVPWMMFGRFGLPFSTVFLFSVPFLAWSEEYLFRYWPHRIATNIALSEIKTMSLTIILSCGVSSVVFLLSHIGSQMELRSLVFSGLFSILMTGLYLWMGLGWATIIHAAFNYISVFKLCELKMRPVFLKGIQP